MAQMEPLCPECGGELDYVETKGHELNDGDYYTPQFIYH